MTAHAAIEPVHEPSTRLDAAYAKAVDTSFVASGPMVRAWHPAPGELVSLWDMLTLNAHLFVGLMDSLGTLARSTADKHKQLADSLVEHGVDQTLAQNILSGWATGKEAVQAQMQMRATLMEIFAAEWEPMLDDLERQCALLQLDFSISQITYIRAMIGVESTFANFANAFRELRRRIMDEIKGRVFVSVSPETQKYISNKIAFGDDVKDKFPELSEDIEGGGDALGVGLFTACVFHLMRVLENGVKHLADHLRVTVNPKDTWGAILNPIDRAIALLPGGRTATKRQLARKEACSEAAAYLRHVKDAWRDKTMHPKRTYTPQEAQAIFEGAKNFMQSLAKLPRR